MKPSEKEYMCIKMANLYRIEALARTLARIEDDCDIERQDMENIKGSWRDEFVSVFGKRMFNRIHGYNPQTKTGKQLEVLEQIRDLANHERIAELDIEESKQVSVLWEKYGLSESIEYFLADRIQCLQIWLDILFGRKNVADLGLEKMVDGIIQSRRSPFKEADGDLVSVEVRWRDPLDMALQRIEKVFPTYMP